MKINAVTASVMSPLQTFNGFLSECTSIYVHIPGPGQRTTNGYDGLWYDILTNQIQIPFIV